MKQICAVQPALNFLELDLIIALLGNEKYENSDEVRRKMRREIESILFDSEKRFVSAPPPSASPSSAQELDILSSKARVSAN